MLIEERGDLVHGNYPVICQQVNCQGVMGSGLAKAIRTEYPEVYKSYKNFLWKCCEFNDSPLGSIDIVPLHDGRYCVNMFAQFDYGRDGRRYTDYDAFTQCLRELEMLLPKEESTVAFPFLIGCGLGGGDWKVVKGLLEDFSRRVKHKVVVVSLYDKH